MEPISNRNFLRINWIRTVSYGRSIPSTLLESIRALGRLLSSSTRPISLNRMERAEGLLSVDPDEFLRMLESNNFPDQHIVVRGSLQLNDSYDLKRLPRNLKFMSNLILSSCASLVELPSELQVEGDLDLSGCTSLKALPERLKLGGTLYLDGCTLLAELPQGLEVRGGIYFCGSTFLTTLPQGLGVGGDLYLCGSPSLTKLSEGLRVEGSLYLTGCRSIRELPAGLHVGGSLNLRDCRLLTEIPDELEVGGDLCLCGTMSLTTLPLGLRVNGKLNLSDSKSLLELPKGLYVGGNLDLSNCTSLTKLPERLYVGGNLLLQGCTSLTELPEGVHVGGDLILSGCTSLIALPARLQLSGNLLLSGCTSLTEMPEGIHVGGYLSLDRCTSLISLPGGLHIEGSLFLQWCSSLTALTEELYVGGSLDLFYCTSFRELPQDLYVGRNLNLEGCTSLTSLPHDITRWGPRADGSLREVNLTNTGLSVVLIDRLRATEAPGMRFHFSHPSTSVADEFDTLDQVVNFWKAFLPQERQSLISLNLSRDQEHDLSRFLNRLIATAEYQNLAARPILAMRILDVLKEMQGNNEFIETASLIIHQGLSTCDDRIISALDQLDLMRQLKKAEGKGEREELRKLGRGMLMLEEVQQAAEAHARSLTWVMEIETLLAFQIGLRDRLQLPLSTSHMIFRGCAQVSDQKIQEVGAEIERRVTDAKVEEYLQTWSPWQKLLRREAFDSLEPEVVQAPEDLEWVCCVGTEELREGYLYEGRLYAHEALRKVYIEKGIDPFTNIPIDRVLVKKVIRGVSF